MNPSGSLPRAKRSLGQNFLINSGIRDRILAALELGASEWVVELGPGPGVLTSPLTERAAHVVAVELDAALAKALPDKVARPEVLEVLEEPDTPISMADTPIDGKIVHYILSSYQRSAYNVLLEGLRRQVLRGEVLSIQEWTQPKR